MTGATTQDYLDRPDQLLVVRDIPGLEAVEIFVIVGADGCVTAFNGHVDLGTGIGTALGQIVAEELDVAFDCVTVVLGDTARTPNQGPTIASETIQVTAKPLRQAAATARQALLARAAERLSLPAGHLRIENGVVIAPPPDNRALTFGELVATERVIVRIDPAAPLKPVEGYRIVGQPVPRVDLPAKATGGLVYVHDMRVPGMLHGRVVRPPYAGVDVGAFVGTSLVAVDEASIAGIPGVVATVVIGDFIGIVAEREEQAALAAERLRVTWKPTPTLPDLTDIPTALRANPEHAARASAPGRHRCRPRGRGRADGSDLRLALPPARIDRAVLFSRGLSAGGADALVRHPEPAHAAGRCRPAARHGRGRHHHHPHGGRRLLWPQLCR